jgi:hypothetical protein
MSTVRRCLWLCCTAYVLLGSNAWAKLLDRAAPGCAIAFQNYSITVADVLFLLHYTTATNHRYGVIGYAINLLK